MDKHFMRLALNEAQRALEKGEVPVGAVLVRDGKLLCSAHNLREQTADIGGHAEILTLRAAARAAGDWRLDGCTLYVTLEPCAMCAAAALQARLGRIVFGAFDDGAGACGSVYDIPHDKRLGGDMQVLGGVLGDEAAKLLSTFFSKKRD